MRSTPSFTAIGSRIAHPIRTTPILAACLVGLATLMFVTSSAIAYESEVSDTPTGRPCRDCHGSSDSTQTAVASRKGPHGDYTTGTDKCDTCHDTHNAPTDESLLPAQTIRATCELCHDGTGGRGVYGVIKAQTGREPVAAHRIDVTNSVPKGSTSGTTSATFSGENGLLTCSDCHSPHDNNTVEPFVGDRMRSASDGPTSTASSRLLKRKPGPGDIEVAVYGSSWCGACHRGSIEATSHAGRMGNHRVETETAGFSYSRVVVVEDTETTQTAWGKMGSSNFGYVMPSPRSVEQTGHGAICQQCHEDSRHVGDDLSKRFQVTTNEAFRVTAPDGQETSDSPRFQTFPHESDNPRFVIETGDDLCLNCHAQ